MGYVVSTRVEKIKQNTNSTKLMIHDFRITTPDYVRRNNSNVILDIHSDNDIHFKTHDIEYLEMMKKRHADLIKDARDDYYKNHGKNLPSNTNFGVCGIVSFGVSDDMKKDRLDNEDTLTDEEAEFVNNQEKDEYVKKYLKSLESEYGVKVLYCVRHSDEKTDHYHFQTINYNFDKNEALYKNMNRERTSQFGSHLQDLASDAFVGTAFERGLKDRPKKKKHLSVVQMHKKEIEILSKRIENEKEIKDRLDKENQATTRKYQIMKNDLDDYDRQKSIKQKEIDRLQEMKKKLEDEKIDEKYQKLQKITSMVENKKSTLERLDEKVTTATVVANQINTDLKEKLSNVVRPKKAVEIDGMFGKKMVDAPTGYVLYSIEDAKKITAIQVQINDFEKQNDCSFNDIMIKQKDIESKSKKLTEDNEKLKQREYELREKHQNELETITKKFQKQVDEKMKEMKNFYEVQISELQNTVDEYKDKMKDFYLKLKDKFSITKEKFDATEMNDRKIGDYNARNR